METGVGWLVCRVSRFTSFVFVDAVQRYCSKGIVQRYRLGCLFTISFDRSPVLRYSSRDAIAEETSLVLAHLLASNEISTIKWSGFSIKNAKRNVGEEFVE